MRYTCPALVAAALVAVLAGCESTPVVPSEDPPGNTRYLDTDFTATSTQTGIPYGASAIFGDR
jgi:hypothetical protein